MMTQNDIWKRMLDDLAEEEGDLLERLSDVEAVRKKIEDIVGGPESVADEAPEAEPDEGPATEADDGPEPEAVGGPYSELTSKKTVLAVLAASGAPSMHNREILAAMRAGGWTTSSKDPLAVASATISALSKDGLIFKLGPGISTLERPDS